MSATSLTNPQSLNLYAYVQNNPIDFVDPSGLNKEMITGSFFAEGGGFCVDYESWDPKTATVSWRRECFFTGGGGGVDKGGMNNCEEKIRNTITDDKTTVFEDTNDGDGTDPKSQDDRTYLPAGTPPPFSGLAGEEHSHLYNSAENRFKENKIYAPPGGRVIANGVVDGQNLTSVYYKNLNGIKDVVLQYSHIENFTGGIIQKDGRLLLGTMGKDGIYTYGKEGGSGYHIHLNAFKWWGGRVPARALKNAISPPKGEGNILREKFRVKLSDAFGC